MTDKTMKAICKLQDEAAPRLIERPIPKIGPLDVLVKVEYAGICKTDLKVARGELPCKPGAVVLGHEFSGTVVECGEHVPYPSVLGHTVSANPMLDDETDRMLGKDVDGCFAEYVSVPYENLVLVRLDDMKLIAYTEPVAAAICAMSNIVGQRIAIAGDPEDRIAKLIAACYIEDRNRTSSLEPRIPIIPPEKMLIDHDLGKSERYDCIIECCPTAAGSLLKCLNRRGTLILKSRGYCELSGVVVNDIVMRELKIVGAKYPYKFDFVLDFMKLNRKLLKPMIMDRDFKLEELEEAFAEASKPNSKKVMFKCAQQLA